MVGVGVGVGGVGVGDGVAVGVGLALDATLKLTRTDAPTVPVPLVALHGVTWSECGPTFGPAIVYLKGLIESVITLPFSRLKTTLFVCAFTVAVTVT